MKDKINLAKKLKALADRGIGGERDNARRMLEKFMLENGITDEDLNSDQTKHFQFKVPKHPALVNKLFYQLVWKIAGLGKIYERSNQRAYLYVLCTSDEAVEIEAQFGFYARLLKKEMDLFYSVFLHKHKIFGEQEIEKDEPELSPEDYKRMMILKAGLSDETYLKQLQEGGAGV